MRNFYLKLRYFYWIFWILLAQLLIGALLLLKFHNYDRAIFIRCATFIRYRRVPANLHSRQIRVTIQFLCMHPLVIFTGRNSLVENFVMMILRKIQYYCMLPVNCFYVHIRCDWDCTFLVASRYGWFTSKHGTLQWSWYHIIHFVRSLDWNNIRDWNV